jgi:hypothetical protein
MENCLDYLLTEMYHLLFLRLLFQMYTQQKMHVKWSNSLSDEFDVRNVVKQGGVLSPVLFAVYIDVLISKLKMSGLGCLN